MNSNKVYTTVLGGAKFSRKSFVSISNIVFDYVYSVTNYYNVPKDITISEYDATIGETKQINVICEFFENRNRTKEYIKRREFRKRISFFNSASGYVVFAYNK